MTSRARSLSALAFALVAAGLVVGDAGSASATPKTESVVGARATDAALAVAVRAEGKLAAPAVPYELLVPEVTYESWRGLSAGCSYLAPKDAGATADGKIDVVVHFHAGQMIEREVKESAGGAVFLSCGYGFGSGPYADAFADPNRFGQMLKSLVSSLERGAGRSGLSIAHLGLASWSAGFAAVGRILSVGRYYAMVDSVVLNDSLHAPYTAGARGVEKRPAQGEERVDLTMMKTFVRFAKDAADGTKTMVMTHSAIVPPDYASSTEATRALLGSIGVPVIDDASTTNARAMRSSYRAERGGLHVHGFRGAGPRDHFDHLHLLGEALRTWVVPTWRRPSAVVVGHVGQVATNARP